MRQLTFACVLVLGCAATTSSETSSSETSSSETSSSETSSGGSEGATTTETGSETPGCEPNACDIECGNSQDDCQQPLEGVCLDEATCMCQPADNNCLPCASESCIAGYHCPAEHSIGGTCEIMCQYDFPPIAWDPQLDCVLQVDEAYASALPWMAITLGNTTGIAAPSPLECSLPQFYDNNFWVDYDTFILHLCPGACTKFEELGSVIISWSMPCE